jgi:transcriptional regulator
MYIPRLYEETDIGVLHSLIRSHPLGAWVAAVESKLVVNHIPFLVDATKGQYGMLVGHVARANTIWQSLGSADPETIVIFQGPQTYISPSWYASKSEHGKVVPTWNYAVVHAHGVPRAIEDTEWLLQHVSQLVDRHESERAAPWSVSDAPPDFIDTLLKGIVGIEIPITTIVGKWKTSQNRSLPDKLGTIAGLYERGDGDSQQMAALVEKHATEG